MGTLYYIALILYLSAIVRANGIKYAGAIYYSDSESSRVAKPVPLKAVSTLLEIRGLTVGIKANLTYENPTNHDIECQFVFPLSSEAAVYHLEAFIGGRWLIAQVEEREKAEQMYQKAVESGKKAVLLESEKGVDDIFRLALGNLPAHETAVVTLGYVQPIDNIQSDGLISVTLPIVLNPRYVPQHQLADPSSFVSSGSYIAVSDIHYPMLFEAKITLGLGRRIVEIHSGNPSDTLDVSYDLQRTRAKAFLLGGLQKKDRDFQIIIKPEKMLEPMVYVEPRLEVSPTEWLSKDIAAAWVVPSLQSLPKISPSDLEIWLLVDRSGSMEGEKIADARQALMTLVERLPNGCRFNIVGFGDSYITLFPRIEMMSDGIRASALRYLANIEADLGGTEMLKPFEHIFNKRKVVKGIRFVLALTDGEVGNTAEVVDLAKRNKATTRIFSIGIGHGASTALVNGLARVTGGQSAFVRDSNDRLEVKVLDMLNAVTTPGLARPRFDWSVSGGRVTRLLPGDGSKPVVSRKILTQFAVIEHYRGESLTGSVVFMAKYEVPFLVGKKAVMGMGDTMPVHRLTAKRLLTRLVDDYRSTKSEAARKSAVKLSKATGVLCEFTAMVAVDSTTEEPVPSIVKAKEPGLEEAEIFPYHLVQSSDHADYLSEGDTVESLTSLNFHQNLLGKTDDAGYETISAMIEPAPEVNEESHLYKDILKISQEKSGLAASSFKTSTGLVLFVGLTVALLVRGF